MSNRGLVAGGVILATASTPTWADAILITKDPKSSRDMKTALILWYVFVAVLVVAGYETFKG